MVSWSWLPSFFVLDIRHFTAEMLQIISLITRLLLCSCYVSLHLALNSHFDLFELNLTNLLLKAKLKGFQHNVFCQRNLTLP